MDETTGGTPMNLTHKASWAQLLIWLITLLFLAGAAYERFATKEYVVVTVDTSLQRHKDEEEEHFKELQNRLDRMEAKVDRLLERGK